MAQGSCKAHRWVNIRNFSLTTQFVAPAHPGTRVTATGRVTGGGASLMFLSGELLDESRRLVASATGVFKRVPT